MHSVSVSIPDIARTALWGTEGAACNDKDGESFLTQEIGDFYRALPDYRSVINFPLEMVDVLRGLAPAGRAVIRTGCGAAPTRVTR